MLPCCHHPSCHPTPLLPPCTLHPAPCTLHPAHDASAPRPCLHCRKCARRPGPNPSRLLPAFPPQPQLFRFVSLPSSDLASLEVDGLYLGCNLWIQAAAPCIQAATLRGQVDAFEFNSPKPFTHASHRAEWPRLADTARSAHSAGLEENGAGRSCSPCARGCNLGHSGCKLMHYCTRLQPYVSQALRERARAAGRTARRRLPRRPRSRRRAKRCAVAAPAGTAAPLCTRTTRAPNVHQARTLSTRQCVTARPLHRTGTGAPRALWLAEPVGH